MGQIINAAVADSGIWDATISSLEGNPVNVNQSFFYTRTGNVVFITGAFTVSCENSVSDEINITVPFINSFADTTKAQGVYNLERPHLAYSNPNELGPVSIYSQTGTNTITLDFTSYSSGTPTFVFYFNAMYLLN